MSGIICAIRGGSASQTTIEKSIELANQTDLTVYYLYVVNLDFLSYTSSSRTHTITKELHELGEFILSMAQTRAEKKGVRAESVIRDGTVGKEIVALAKEVSANYVVLGKPQGGEEEDVFTHERLRTFSDKIEQESGAKVVFAGGHEE